MGDRNETGGSGAFLSGLRRSPLFITVLAVMRAAREKFSRHECFTSNIFSCDDLGEQPCIRDPPGAIEHVDLLFLKCFWGKCLWTTQHVDRMFAFAFAFSFSIFSFHDR